MMDKIEDKNEPTVGTFELTDSEIAGNSLTQTDLQSMMLRK